MLKEEHRVDGVVFTSLKLDGGMLVPSSATDENALLRARTLLAYLHDTNQLQYTTIMGLVFVQRIDAKKKLSNGDIDLSVDFKAGGDVAAIGTIPFQPIHKQPAVALYRADPDVHDAFVNVWIKSSLAWLEKNPADRVRLEITYPKE